MSVELVGQNVVIVARLFNPSVLSQLWLVRHGLIAEDDFESGCLFSDSLVQASTANFNLILVPEQFQFVPKVGDDLEQALIVEKVGAIVSHLPHTPYTAVGLNFLYHLTPEDGDAGQLSRQMFFRPETPLYQNFNSEGALYGAYLSKDFDGCRLRLDIKPVTVPLPDTRKETRLHFGFNFHLDLAGDEGAVDNIVAMLNRWTAAKAEAVRIVNESLTIERVLA